MAPFLYKHVMLAWSQVVGIVSVVHMRVRRVRIALIREVLWLYLRPSVFTLSVPALLPFLKDFSTSFISSASGGFSLMLKGLSWYRCWKSSGRSSSGGSGRSLASKCFSKCCFSFSLEIVLGCPDLNALCFLIFQAPYLVRANYYPPKSNGFVPQNP